MPAKSRQQEKFIMANAAKFGGKAKAKREWLDPVKGKKLPKKVTKKGR